MLPSKPLFEAVCQPFKRSALGLFHGKMRLTGNNVPHSKQKTLRTWLPNVQKKRLFSDILQQFVRTTVTVRALRVINKCGGLDNYVMNTRHELLKWEGMRIRVMIRDKLARDAAAKSGEENSALKTELDALRLENIGREESERKAIESLESVTLKKPTLEDARKDRLAAAALAKKTGTIGKQTLAADGAATAEETIAFLKQHSPRLAGNVPQYHDKPYSNKTTLHV